MPAIVFNLWNPYRADDGSLIFEVTQADTFRLNSGSRELMTAALDALGIAAPAASWQITHGRSLYYSDDPEAPDWRDRWPRTWRVTVAFEAPLPARPNKLFRQRATLGLTDDTWSEPDAADDDRYLHTAFAIVDFRTSRDEVAALVGRVLAGTALHGKLRPPEIRDLGTARQLQLTACELDLPGDLAALEALVAELKAADGVENWRLRLTWPVEPAKAPPGLDEWLRSSAKKS